MENNLKIYIYITESLCCTPETKKKNYLARRRGKKRVIAEAEHAHTL